MSKPTVSKATVHKHPAAEPAPEPAPAPAVIPDAAVTATGADFGEYANAGFQDVGKDDLAIPFLSILQGLSPEVKRSEGAYIDGAQEGMLINTVTKAVYDTTKAPLTVIPCAYQRAFVEWRVREKGGGFIADHGLNQPGETERDDRGRDILANGNQLNDTRSFYVLVLDAAGAVTPAVLTMTSTQIKKAKQWLMQQSLLRLGSGGKSYTPPMFASKWRVETVPESNEKGSWFGWKFTHAGYLDGPNDPLFQEAVLFNKSVVTGAVKADQSKAAEPPNADGPATTGGHYPSADEDDVVF